MRRTPVTAIIGKTTDFFNSNGNDKCYAPEESRTLHQCRLIPYDPSKPTERAFVEKEESDVDEPAISVLTRRSLHIVRDKTEKPNPLKEKNEEFRHPLKDVLLHKPDYLSFREACEEYMRTRSDSLLKQNEHIIIDLCLSLKNYDGYFQIALHCGLAFSENAVRYAISTKNAALLKVLVERAPEQFRNVDDFQTNENFFSTNPQFLKYAIESESEEIIDYIFSDSQKDESSGGHIHVLEKMVDIAMHQNKVSVLEFLQKKYQSDPKTATLSIIDLHPQFLAKAFCSGHEDVVDFAVLNTRQKKITLLSLVEGPWGHKMLLHAPIDSKDSFRRELKKVSILSIDSYREWRKRIMQALRVSQPFTNHCEEYSPILRIASLHKDEVLVDILFDEIVALYERQKKGDDPQEAERRFLSCLKESASFTYMFKKLCDYYLADKQASFPLSEKDIWLMRLDKMSLQELNSWKKNLERPSIVRYLRSVGVYYPTTTLSNLYMQ